MRDPSAAATSTPVAARMCALSHLPSLSHPLLESKIHVGAMTH